MDLFDYFNNLRTDVVLTPEETKDFQPFLINKWLFYSGQHDIAQALNPYVFGLNQHEYYLTLKTFLYNKFIRWNYLKKPKKVEVNFFIKDIAKYYKINFSRAEEVLEILSQEQLLNLTKKFGYDDKQKKKLGFNIKKQKKVKKEKQQNIGEWW